MKRDNWKLDGMLAEFISTLKGREKYEKTDKK